MEVEFLGTGTSQGVPIIGCQCEVCTSSDPKDNRLRSSVLILVNGKRIVIDAGPDFRYQMLRSHNHDLDAVLLTHEHKDHIGGLDDIRPFNYMKQKAISIVAETRVCEAIRSEYHYVFVENPYPGVPQMDLNEIESGDFVIAGVQVLAIRGIHGSLPVLGFRIGRFAYLTDMNYISPEELTKLSGIHTLVISALRKKPHSSHFHLEASLDVIRAVRPETAYLTHISHEFGMYAKEELLLPLNVFLAFDGLKIHIKD